MCAREVTKLLFVGVRTLIITTCASHIGSTLEGTLTKRFDFQFSFQSHLKSGYSYSKSEVSFRKFDVK